MKNISLAVLALFGLTEASKLSYRPPKGSNPWHETSFALNKELEPDFPHGYKVPNFGVDVEIKQSLKNLKKAEGLQKKKLSKGFKYPAPPAAVPDLRRPEFGAFEDDIATNLKHLKMAEVERNHKMEGKWPFSQSIPDLRRPNYGDKDVEIEYTHKNIADAEKRLKSKLKASFGKAAPVPDLRRPNFGNFDADIQTSINNAKLASKEKKGKSFV